MEYDWGAKGGYPSGDFILLLFAAHPLGVPSLGVAHPRFKGPSFFFLSEYLLGDGIS